MTTITTKKKLMKVYLLITLVFGCFVLCSCDETVQENPIDKGMINTKQVNMLNDIAMENAIIVQCTLCPYHFIKDSEQLNKLGQRDLSIMAEHLRTYPGQLNIQQGDTPLHLYQKRVALTSQKLQNAGVDMTKVSIADAIPAGKGMSTDDVVEIQKADRKARTDRREKYPQLSERNTNQ